MKQLHWPTNSDEHAYMKARQNQNKARSLYNKNENWAEKRLGKTGKIFNRQTQWGYRVFDFWCHELGCAVEVDGPEHDADYDAHRDEYNYRRSGVIVIRVQNECEDSMDRAIAIIAKLSLWEKRRVDMGLRESSKSAKRRLASLPKYPLLLPQFINSILVTP